MQCPVCDERLREVEKYGVMIDLCPSCKGIWLDRGELEKIVGLEERGDLDRDHRGKDDEHRRDHHDDHHSGGEYKGHKTKRRSFLSDLMEGFGD
jgi:Zn-finger nucleic acid-binding protein